MRAPLGDVRGLAALAACLAVGVALAAPAGVQHAGRAPARGDGGGRPAGIGHPHSTPHTLTRGAAGFRAPPGTSRGFAAGSFPVARGRPAPGAANVAPRSAARLAPANHGHGGYSRPHGYARGYPSAAYPLPAYYTFVPAVPWYVETVWWNGVPYYTADNVYYVWNGDAAQYQVVPPPVDVAPADESGSDPSPPVSAATDEDRARRDHEDCARWAADQSGVDPRTPAFDAGDRRRGDFLRAEAACLDGRGYPTP